MTEQMSEQTLAVPVVLWDKIASIIVELPVRVAGDVFPEMKAIAEKYKSDNSKIN